MLYKFSAEWSNITFCILFIMHFAVIILSNLEVIFYDQFYEHSSMTIPSSCRFAKMFGIKNITINEHQNVNRCFVQTSLWKRCFPQNTFTSFHNSDNTAGWIQKSTIVANLNQQQSWWSTFGWTHEMRFAIFTLERFEHWLDNKTRGVLAHNGLEIWELYEIIILKEWWEIFSIFQSYGIL